VRVGIHFVLSYARLERLWIVQNRV